MLFRPIVGLTISAALLASCAGSSSEPETLQGWSDPDRYAWYDATQGSRLIPYSWLRALEQPGGQGAFADPSYLETFGYLRSRGDRREILPIGFAIDQQPDTGFKVTGLRWYEDQKGDRAGEAEQWVGLNCAACHTAELSYKGNAVRVDGGPGLGDFQSFIEALDLALRETIAQDDRFDRFAAKVLAGKDTPRNRQNLKDALGKLVAWEERVEDANRTPLRYGFARVDAFGHIFNKVALFNGAEDQVRNPADAPVSYPFLWDIYRQKRVQWNGVVENTPTKVGAGTMDFGALGRNSGEVIGVFGEVLITKPGGLGQTFKGYKSSLQVKNLDRMEVLLRKLRAPAWPAAFPAIDTALAARGKITFDRDCASCHLPREQWVADKPIERMMPLNTMKENLTDIWMACNAVTYVARTGNLKGTKFGFISGEPLQANELIVKQLQTTVKGALIGKKGDIVAVAADTFIGVDRRPKVIPGAADAETADDQREARREFCKTDTDKLLAYKARPLNGIWATAPYLHNGSVPTLFHLLQAPADRPRTFWVGSREFDPQFVGYIWKDRPAGPAFEFSTHLGDQPIDGNSNEGHDYGASSLTDAQRWELVEYMKTL